MSEGQIEPETDAALTTQLQGVIDDFDCVAGTIHLVDGAETLTLAAQVNIPEVVLEKTRTIPFGKGIAGLAAQQVEPVEVCNLQTDDSGIAEKGARDTGMEGSLAAPMLDAEGGLVGVIGVAKPDAYDFSDEEHEQLIEAGKRVAAEL